jgi:nitroreductase
MTATVTASLEADVDALDAIFTRRSVRQYTAETISDEHVETLLRAAMAAPSAGNQQIWELVVIDERRLLDGIATVHPYAHMCTEAALAIAVCADPAREKYPGFWVQDCAAATENILIAANALGLGAVWLGIDPQGDRGAAIRELLGLPVQIEPLAIVAVGHPRIKPQPENRYDLHKTHHNGW